MVTWLRSRAVGQGGGLFSTCFTGNSTWQGEGRTTLNKVSQAEIVFLPHAASLLKQISLGKAGILLSYILLQVGVILGQALYISDKAGILSVSLTAAVTVGMKFQSLLRSLLLAQQCLEAEAHGVSPPSLPEGTAWSLKLPLLIPA